MPSLTSIELNLMLSLQPKYCQAFRTSKGSPATNVSYALFQFHDPTSSDRDEILTVMKLTKLSFFNTKVTQPDALSFVETAVRLGSQIWLNFNFFER
jgi:hypothetical protein